eukprot:g10608.t1
MRVCGIVLLLSAAARGLVTKAGSESPSERLHLPQLQDKGAPADLALTRSGLYCRGGSSAARGAGTAGWLGRQRAGKRGLPAGADADGRWGAKQGWGQLRRSPEARTSSSTKLVSARGGANAATSADASKAAYRTALLRTALLVCSAGAFGLGTWVVKGKTSALEFFAGYIVEQSLSVDNLFIFIMLFDYFKVPSRFQSRVLNWGIIGAVSMRAIMIVVGVAAIQRFRSVMLVFAGILVVSSVKLLMEGAEEEHDSAALEGNMVLRIANWMMDSVDYYDGERFFTLVNGAKKATPLLLCLICIEMTDFVFAVDSIPAVLAISHDTFIVYASNVFAICAMRSIYTLVSHAISDLPYLKPAVALVLGFVGGKMFAEFFHYDISVGLSLAVVCGILSVGAIASVISNRRRDAAVASSVSGGGSSGLTFESFSAEAEKEGGHGEGFAAAAATAAAATAEGGESSTPSLPAMEEGVPAAVMEGLAAAEDGAASAVSDAAEAAQAVGDAAGDAAAAAAADAEEGALVGENAGAATEEVLQGDDGGGDAVVEGAESVAAEVEAEGEGEGEAGVGVEVTADVADDVVPAVEQEVADAAAATDQNDQAA